MEELISVIVPVYNVEAYLERCIVSLRNQTYPSLEIILVNDGSTDQSGVLCERAAQHDQRIRVIHKDNGGLSDARNAGLDVATGKYIGFVDSDDFIAVDMYEQLYKTLMNVQADIAEVHFMLTDGQAYQKQKSVQGEYLFDHTQALKAFFSGNLIENNVGFKLFKKSCIDGLRFKVGYTSEDLFFTFESLMQANIVAINKNYTGYYYFMRPNSIVNQAFSERDLDAVQLSEQLVEQVPAAIQAAANAKLIREKMKCVAKMIYKRAGNQYDELKKDYLAAIRHYPLRDARRYLSRKHQLTLFIMKCSPSFYVWLYKKFQKQ